MKLEMNDSEKMHMQAIFNPDVEEMLSSSKKCILFAHVGKCAGEAAMTFLREALDDNHVLFEMHVYDADKKIAELSQFHPNDFIFLVARRDPVTRFVSAYNWDKHNLYLSGRIQSDEINSFYEEFPNSESIALGLVSDDPETQRKAKKFVKYAHMGMGQSFYTPHEVLDRIPAERLHVFSMETLDDDLRDFVQALTGERPDLQIKELRGKTNYKKQYEDAAKLFPTHISDEAKAALKAELAEEYSVYNRLGNI